MWFHQPYEKTRNCVCLQRFGGCADSGCVRFSSERQSKADRHPIIDFVRPFRSKRHLMALTKPKSVRLLSGCTLGDV